MFAVKGEHGRALLAGLIAWAQRCRIPEFTALARTLGHQHRSARLRVPQRRRLITMAGLTRGGLRPDLPAR